MAMRLLLGTFLIFIVFSVYSAPSFAASPSSASRQLLAATPASVVQQYLVPQNQVPVQLGLRPLQWSEKLAGYALWWSKQRKGGCALVHSSGNYGQNIFRGRGRNWRPADAVNAWAAERAYYDRASCRCLNNRDCLHYTQLVWRQSLKVGCAVVLCGRGNTYITCSYDPHGNVMGQRPY